MGGVEGSVEWYGGRSWVVSSSRVFVSCLVLIACLIVAVLIKSRRRKAERASEDTDPRNAQHGIPGRPAISNVMITIVGGHSLAHPFIHLLRSPILGTSPLRDERRRVFEAMRDAMGCDGDECCVSG